MFQLDLHATLSLYLTFFLLFGLLLLIFIQYTFLWKLLYLALYKDFDIIRFIGIGTEFQHFMGFQFYRLEFVAVIKKPKMSIISATILYKYILKLKKLKIRKRIYWKGV